MSKQSKGGIVRAQVLTPEQRQAIARKGADARWKTDPNLQYAVCSGHLKIGDVIIDCAVLEDGRRVITRNSMMKALGQEKGGRKRGRAAQEIKEGAHIPAFLSFSQLIPLIPSKIREGQKHVRFRYLNKDGVPIRGICDGYECEILPMTCQIFFEAYEKGLLKEKQLDYHKQCLLIYKGLAYIGITSLIDEATGYEKFKEKNELQRLLSAYIAEERMKYVRRFPEEFFSHLYRIYGLKKDAELSNHPRFFAGFINRWVYGELPDGVLEEIQRLNPMNESGYRGSRHHQYLTLDVGCKHLSQQLERVVMCMRLSKDVLSFKKNYAIMTGQPVNLELDFDC